MTEIRAVGAVVRLDPEPERRIEAFKRELSEQKETGENGESLVSDYAAGRYVLGEMHCWALIEQPGGVIERRDGVVIDTIWLRYGDTASSLLHAREVFEMSTSEIRANLAKSGADTGADALDEMRPDIELAPDVREALRRTSPTSEPDA